MSFREGESGQKRPLRPGLCRQGLRLGAESAFRTKKERVRGQPELSLTTCSVWPQGSELAPRQGPFALWLYLFQQIFWQPWVSRPIPPTKGVVSLKLRLSLQLRKKGGTEVKSRSLDIKAWPMAASAKAFWLRLPRLEYIPLGWVVNPPPFSFFQSRRPGP